MVVLNSANMRNKKSNDMSDEQVIKEEIAKIKRLRSDYDILAADPLSNDAIIANKVHANRSMYGNSYRD